MSMYNHFHQQVGLPQGNYPKWITSRNNFFGIAFHQTIGKSCSSCWILCWWPLPSMQRPAHLSLNLFSGSSSSKFQLGCSELQPAGTKVQHAPKRPSWTLSGILDILIRMILFPSHASIFTWGCPSMHETNIDSGPGSHLRVAGVRIGPVQPLLASCPSRIRMATCWRPATCQVFTRSGRRLLVFD